MGPPDARQRSLAELTSGGHRALPLSLAELPQLSHKRLLIVGGFGAPPASQPGAHAWRTTWDTFRAYGGDLDPPKEALECARGCDYYAEDAPALSFTPDGVVSWAAAPLSPSALAVLRRVGATLTPTPDGKGALLFGGHNFQPSSAPAGASVQPAAHSALSVHSALLGSASTQGYSPTGSASASGLAPMPPAGALAFNDLTLLRLDRLHAHALAPRGSPPTARSYHAATLACGRLLVIGGYAPSVPVGERRGRVAQAQWLWDVHAVDLRGEAWERVRTLGEPPEALCRSSACSQGADVLHNGTDGTEPGAAHSESVRSKVRLSRRVLVFGGCCFHYPPSSASAAGAAMGAGGVPGGGGVGGAGGVGGRLRLSDGLYALDCYTILGDLSPAPGPAEARGAEGGEEAASEAEARSAGSPCSSSVSPTHSTAGSASPAPSALPSQSGGEEGEEEEHVYARWVQLQAQGNPPGARCGHAAIMVGDRMLVHGGLRWLRTHDGGGDGGGGGARGRDGGAKAAASAEGGRVGLAHDLCVLECDGGRYVWSRVQHTPPMRREGHTLSTLTKDAVVLFGGWSGCADEASGGWVHPWAADAFVLHVPSGKWAKLRLADARARGDAGGRYMPAGRYGHCALVVDTARAAGARCTATGAGLSSARAGEEVCFEVRCRDVLGIARTSGGDSLRVRLCAAGAVDGGAEGGLCGGGLPRWVPSALPPPADAVALAAVDGNGGSGGGGGGGDGGNGDGGGGSGDVVAAATRISVVDRGDGSYSVRYCCTVARLYRVHVEVAKEAFDWLAQGAEGGGSGAADGALSSLSSHSTAGDGGVGGEAEVEAEVEAVQGSPFTVRVAPADAAALRCCWQAPSALLAPPTSTPLPNATSSTSSALRAPDAPDASPSPFSSLSPPSPLPPPSTYSYMGGAPLVASAPDALSPAALLCVWPVDRFGNATLCARLSPVLRLAKVRPLAEAENAGGEGEAGCEAVSEVDGRGGGEDGWAVRATAVVEALEQLPHTLPTARPTSRSTSKSTTHPAGGGLHEQPQTQQQQPPPPPQQQQLFGCLLHVRLRTLRPATFSFALSDGAGAVPVGCEVELRATLPPASLRARHRTHTRHTPRAARAVEEEMEEGAVEGASATEEGEMEEEGEEGDGEIATPGEPFGWIEVWAVDGAGFTVGQLPAELVVTARAPGAGACELPSMDSEGGTDPQVSVRVLCCEWEPLRKLGERARGRLLLALDGRKGEVVLTIAPRVAEVGGSAEGVAVCWAGVRPAEVIVQLTGPPYFLKAEFAADAAQLHRAAGGGAPLAPLPSRAQAVAAPVRTLGTHYCGLPGPPVRVWACDALGRRVQGVRISPQIFVAAAAGAAGGAAGGARGGLQEAAQEGALPVGGGGGRRWEEPLPHSAGGPQLRVLHLSKGRPQHANWFETHSCIPAASTASSTAPLFSLHCSPSTASSTAAPSESGWPRPPSAAEHASLSLVPLVPSVYLFTLQLGGKAG
ncbi:hypothetical protein T492DRAFT_222044 [Pavlovales sp. CCMP2436]|nr:hypothetical protein T492DRAFT_222044 [Pavlovales sp. CCMP2436]